MGGLCGLIQFVSRDTFEITCTNWLQRRTERTDYLAAERKLPFKAGNGMTMYRWYNMVVWGLVSKLGAEFK